MMAMGLVPRGCGPTMACTRLRYHAVHLRLHALVVGLVAKALARSRAAGEAGSVGLPALLCNIQKESHIRY